MSSVPVSTENYLKEIYELSQLESPVKTSRLAAALGVSPAAVTEMVKRLQGQRLLSYRPYHGVRLTPSGQRLALQVIRRQRLWEVFLFKMLGLSWAEVHVHAHRLEHATDEQLADALDAFLGHPIADPHGAPIPGPGGELELMKGRLPLTDLAPGTRATIIRCRDESPELLAYLDSLHLVPGTEVRVVDKAPFDGPLTLEVEGRDQTIGLEAARTLIVQRT